MKNSRRQNADSTPPAEPFTVEWIPLDSLVEYAHNARKIPESAVDKVADSLKAFGWQQVILVDGDMEIIAGHVRRRAALKLGWTHGWVKIDRTLTPAQKKAYRLMDNRSHTEATFDNELLIPELIELRDKFDLDMSLTGFDPAEIDALLKMPDLMDPSDGNEGGQAATDWLKWSNKKIPITGEELQGLNAALSSYVDREGVNYGFVTSLLRKIKTGR